MILGIVFTKSLAVMVVVAFVALVVFTIIEYLDD